MRYNEGPPRGPGCDYVEPGHWSDGEWPEVDAAPAPSSLPDWLVVPIRLVLLLASAAITCLIGWALVTAIMLVF